MTDRQDIHEPSGINNPVNHAAPVQPRYTVHTTEQFEHKPAGFWIRFWAYLIDLLVVSSITSIIVYPIFRAFGWDLEGNEWYAPIGFITGFIFYAYFVLMTKFFSQTVGKMVFGLKVIPLKSTALNFSTILFREWIGRFFSATIWPLYWVVGFTPKKQGLHDFIADTTVIHEQTYEKKIHKTYHQANETGELQQPGTL